MIQTHSTGEPAGSTQNTLAQELSTATSLCASVDVWDASQALPPEARLPFPVAPYVDPLYIPPVVRPDANGQLQIYMVPARAQLHSQLPNLTNVWVYRDSRQICDEPQVPVGQTIEVQQGQPAYVEWSNDLKGADGNPAKHPVVTVRDLPAYVRSQSGEVHAVENLPGFTRGKHDHTVPDLPPWTTVHLHGGRTEANSDGWPENSKYPGQVQRDVYDNNQPGTLLWYHDHGMGITRLNVFAGLAGFYIIRDPLEKELGLPCDDNHELLLLIQDRALTCAGDHEGIAAAQLLHKTGKPGGDQAPMEFFGPLTLVNGRIWPRHSVEAGVYRLRILNGSNARTYRLRFTDEQGQLLTVPIHMIGSDGGLLAKVIDLNDPSRPYLGSITLAPAERVDVLVDFSKCQGRVELRNFAKAPFDGNDADPKNPLADFLTYPQVMAFDVGKPNHRYNLLPVGQSLLKSATPWLYQDVQKMNPVERLVGLVEDTQGVLQLMECASLNDAQGNPRFWDEKSDLPPMQLALKQRNETQWRLYCLLPGMFSDSVRFLARDGDVEIWKLINLSPDTHPIHLHLVQFKLLARDPYVVANVPKDPQKMGGFEADFNSAAQPVSLDPADCGWKDTIRVNPEEMTAIAVPFRAYAPDDKIPESGKPIGMTGRYVYHCHILEHEDHEMMRPYVVMPPQIIDHMRSIGASMTHAETASQPGTAHISSTPAGGWYMEPDLCCCDDKAGAPH